MGIIELLSSLLKFLILVLGYVFDAWKQKDSKGAQAQLNQNLFFEAAEKALEKMRTNLKSDSSDTNSIDDQMDKPTPKDEKKSI